MTIYIAAPYELRDEAIRVMQMLEGRGHIITSTWLREIDEEGDKYARIDLADVARATTFLLLNPKEYKNKGTGGRHVELGYALAFGKKIIIAGARSNIFHHLSDIRVIEHVVVEEF